MAAISSGDAPRPAGVVAASTSNISPIAALAGVLVGPGATTFHAYACGPVLGRPRLGKGLDRRLGGAVGGQAVHADRGGHCRDADDRPTALGGHLRRDGRRQEEGGLDVHSDRGVEVGLAQLVGWAAGKIPALFTRTSTAPASSPRRLTSSKLASQPPRTWPCRRSTRSRSPPHCHEHGRVR